MKHIIIFCSILLFITACIEDNPDQSYEYSLNVINQEREPGELPMNDEKIKNILNSSSIPKIDKFYRNEVTNYRRTDYFENLKFVLISMLFDKKIPDSFDSQDALFYFKEMANLDVPQIKNQYKLLKAGLVNAQSQEIEDLVRKSLAKRKQDKHLTPTLEEMYKDDLILMKEFYTL